jgi:hypothetical protein
MSAIRSALLGSSAPRVATMASYHVRGSNPTDNDFHEIGCAPA